jgi:hypothetical protein
LALVIVSALVGALSSQAQPTQDCRFFAETRQEVCGKFLAYWDSHGGLAQQGYPISGEFVEVSDLNGQPYTVQYFERAVFELHPENQPPYDVLLTQLGTLRGREKYPNGFPNAGVSIPFYEDRSGPVELMQSFYNAVNRKEYERAYGYIEQGNLTISYDDLVAFYQPVSLVTTYFGTPTIEGAAGSTYASVPFVAVGTYADSTVRTFYGCFVLRHTNPGIDPDPNATLWRIYDYKITEAPPNLPIAQMLEQGCEE